MSRLENLRAAIIKATDLLPAQGPITAFVFDNTLRGLEDLPFHQALKRGSELFGCQPYLSIERFIEKLRNGRITEADLSAVLADDLGESADEPILGLCTRRELRFAMLKHPLKEAPAAELRWFIAEADAMRKFLPDVPPQAQEAALQDTRDWVADNGPEKVLNGKSLESLGAYKKRTGTAALTELRLKCLWELCRRMVEATSQQTQRPKFVRHRDAVKAVTLEDSDLLVNEILIRFSAAFVDQGLAEWVLPHREDGFLSAFIKIYGRPGGPPSPWTHGLVEELDRIAFHQLGALDSIALSLDALGVSEEETSEFITATLLALRGWAGLLWQNETRSDRVPIPVPKDTLIEFLAVRLVLERFALKHVSHEYLSFNDSLGDLREFCVNKLCSATATSTETTAANDTTAVTRSERDEARAFSLFQVAQFLGWPLGKLATLTAEEMRTLVTEVESFESLERRRIFHLAFERNYRQRALNAVSSQTKQRAQRVQGVKFQAVFCIDAREESFRRHLEETDSHVETFGAPGFFCLPIYYRGLGDAHFSTLCPIVLRPQHWVIEEPVYSMSDVEGRRATARRAIGSAGHSVSKGSRNMVRGAVITASLGVLASVPLVTRVLFPRLTAKIRRQAESLVKPVPVTRLRMERLDEKASSTETGFGFTLPEMANFGERILRDIGLVNGFARLVMFLGHGSVCQNNPHKSAYDCGACSGMAGMPNARALSAMLNDPRVREILATRGINIPPETHFLGGLHNTGDDTITFTDVDFLPRSHRPEFEAAKDILDEACLRNSHERCRRFYSAPLTLTPQEAHLHVEDRTEDLAQVRPEFGNSTNAMCYVGRRSRVSGLYMDRRCFMHSYDHTTDDADATILGRILGAVVFVCAGINLQYLFSYVDSPGWGSGTKLPHNITSLLGVMDGAASDLRTGLPWQGVEIHEPVRLLFVIESTPENLTKIMDRNAVVGRLIRNEWVQLTVLNPESNELMHFKQGNWVRFEPDAKELPVVERSSDWYRGQREHLGFATIKSPAAPS